jgi:NAD(P)-dependent dehydrogenase (short-subunit alcohol dehydrogenase family)
MSKVALVTGASSGIGESAVEELIKKGFTVYAVARRVDRMGGLAEKGAHVLAMDVTDEESMVSGVKRIVAEQGRIDVLVNNAGYGSYGAVEDVPLDEARRQFEVNLFGLARLCQLVLPQMREQGSGRIINISSIGARLYEPFGAWYHATKFAVEGFSSSLRMEVKPFGVHVSCVAPAGIMTEWNPIARNALLETSGETAYGKHAHRAFKMLETADKPITSSKPGVVGKKIAKAATARRPKPVYPVGKGARMIRSTFDLLPEGVTDQVISRAYGTR